MKNMRIMLAAIVTLAIYSCTLSGSKTLFDGTANNLWDLSGRATMQEGKLILDGQDARAVLKGGRYKDFCLSMQLRTTAGGKGFVGIHTGKAGDGYRIAINNDTADPVWWRMTGSLMSVRNLTKRFVAEEQWFHLRICVEGRLVAVSIDGRVVVEYIEPEKPYRMSGNENAVLGEGTFSLVSTGDGSIEFKEIVVETIRKEHINEALLELARDEQSDEFIRLHQEDFPLLDYHVHLKGGLTKEMAAVQSRRLGVNYAIAPNCGIGFAVTNDEQVYEFLDAMKGQPFILAMQGEGREWSTTFSKEVRDAFDFVFTDAMTFYDNRGRRVQLWINELVVIDDEQKYMDMIVDRTCTVLKEPFDIYVNPFYLPDAMSDRYDYFWTDERVDRVIDELVATGKVLELNELYQIPSKRIVLKAKEAGIKFSFGSNNITPEVTGLEHGIRMKKECGLTPAHMHNPYIKIQ